MPGLISNLKIERPTFFEIKNLILGFSCQEASQWSKNQFFFKIYEKLMPTIFVFLFMKLQQHA